MCLNFLKHAKHVYLRNQSHNWSPCNGVLLNRISFMSSCNDKNRHPRDEHISLDVERHSYSIKGSSDSVTSVTTLLSQHFRKFDPEETINKNYIRWQKDGLNKYHRKSKEDTRQTSKEDGEKARADFWQNRSNKYDGKSKEQIKQKWKEDGEKARSDGTRLHAAIESNYLGTASNDDYDKNTKEWKHFLSFQNEHKLEPYRTEWKIWSDYLKLAGTVDMLVKNKNNTLTIYDFKRVKDKICKEEHNWGRFGIGPLSDIKDNKYNRYAMQLNIYRELLERYYGLDIASMRIVRLHPTASSFEVVEIPMMKDETNGVLEQRRVHITGDRHSQEDVERSSH